jgi:hypothetical protein
MGVKAKSGLTKTKKNIKSVEKRHNKTLFLAKNKKITRQKNNNLMG